MLILTKFLFELLNALLGLNELGALRAQVGLRRVERVLSGLQLGTKLFSETLSLLELLFEHAHLTIRITAVVSALAILASTNVVHGLLGLGETILGVVEFALEILCARLCRTDSLLGLTQLVLKRIGTRGLTLLAVNCGLELPLGLIGTSLRLCEPLDQ
jgi:hypothetical protein